VYRISELAAKLGLSRTAQLHYEKLGLISGSRLRNGYRVYEEKHLQRLRLIQRLQADGFTLKECKQFLQSKIDKEIVKNRLVTLELEISKKQGSRDLLHAILGEGDIKAWHEDLNRIAPDAHLDWLKTQGFSEKEALRLKWLSKNMNEHDKYIKDFMKVFEQLDFWAPGSKTETLKALSLLPIPPKHILEIGCGNGIATIVLAEYTEAIITAVDNEQIALDRLVERFTTEGMEERLEAVLANMSDLPFPKERFDLIWAEGSAYVIGVEVALKQWKQLLKKKGYLVLSDMVWRTETPSPAAAEFWEREYPDMKSVEARILQIETAGYKVINHFPLSEEAWLNYYDPLRGRLSELELEMQSSEAIKDLKHEVFVGTKFAEEFGYHMFILEKG